jgi:hypothetical protein
MKQHYVQLAPGVWASEDDMRQVGAHIEQLTGEETDRQLTARLDQAERDLLGRIAPCPCLICRRCRGEEGGAS